MLPQVQEQLDLLNVDPDERALAWAQLPAKHRGRASMTTWWDYRQGNRAAMLSNDTWCRSLNRQPKCALRKDRYST